MQSALSGYILVFLTCMLFISACKKDKAEGVTDSLSGYINSHSTLSFNKGGVIAFAAGGPQFSKNISPQISIFFYPLEGSVDYRYFESERLDINIHDLSLYQRRDIPVENIFNGHVKLFKHPGTKVPRWAIVAFISMDTLFISNPINIKILSKPTEVNPNRIEIDLTNPTEPLFSWQEGIYHDNFIYFQLISDLSDNLISATFTVDRYFQFYNLDNVVKNIYDIHPHPELTLHEYYRFTLMAISNDNWINLYAEKGFVTR